jgi:hypothetical protein
MLVTLPAARHAPAPLKIAIVSGLSDPASCALSELQRAFLDRLDAPRDAIVDRNFPFVDAVAPRRAPPLWLASLRNLNQFLGASRPSYAAHARRHWRALRDSADALVIITLSCGLEILRHCVEPEDARRAIHVLALGPVARALPDLPCTLVQGTRDPISHLFFRDAIRIPNVGHLDYFRSNTVLTIANQILCSNTSRSSAADSIFRSAV